MLSTEGRPKSISDGEWSNVLFEGKSRFSVQPGSRRILIWSKIDTLNNIAFVLESVEFDERGVIIRAGVPIKRHAHPYIMRD